MRAVQDRPGPNLLVIGEDLLSCRVASFVLSEEGLNVYTVNSPQAALAILARTDVSLVIFDSIAPTDADEHLLQEVRRLRGDLPVMLLVASSTSAEPLSARQLVDDYLVKPFSYAELVARVRAGLRRAKRDAAPDRVIVKAAGLVLDVPSLTVALPNGKKVFLSPTEMKVLHCLMTRQGELVTRETLTEAIWGPGCGEDGYIRVCISRVRRKLGRCNSEAHIEAVRGAGYRLNVRGC